MRIWDHLLNSFNETLKNEYQGTENKEDNISKKVSKGKSVKVVNPTSQRTITKGKDYTTGDVKVGEETSKDTDRVVTRSSSAIDNVEYNPNTNTASVTFRGGGKAYDYEVTPEEFNDFLNASSKGRHIASLWNHNPHFEKK